MLNQRTPPQVIVSNMTAAPPAGFTSRMFYLDVSIRVPDGWVNLTHSRGWREADGSTRWMPFSVKAKPPLHATRLEIISIPPVWWETIRRAVAEAIDDFDGLAVG